MSWSDGVSPIEPGRTSFEWALDRQYLLQRSENPQPEFPDSVSIIALAGDGPSYTQHYFDTRGVVRLYAMSLEGDTWTLLREAPDFTPLSFSQRYVGQFSADGSEVHGTWEKTVEGGEHFGLDFHLDLKRIG